MQNKRLVKSLLNLEFRSSDWAKRLFFVLSLTAVLAASTAIFAAFLLHRDPLTLSRWFSPEFLEGAELRRAVAQADPGTKTDLTLNCDNFHLLPEFETSKSGVADACREVLDSQRQLPSRTGVQIYPERIEVHPGQTATFRVSLRSDLKTDDIVRIELLNLTTNQRIERQPKGGQPTIRHSPCVAFFGAGCDFRDRLLVETKKLKPGLYKISMTTRRGHGGESFFVVSGSQSGTKQVLIIPEYTIHAYSKIGGGSLYRAVNSTKNVGVSNVKDRRLRVSMNRYTKPETEDQKYHAFSQFGKLSNILSEMVDGLTVVSQSAMIENRSFFENAETIFLAGHPEYWTLDQVNIVKNAVFEGSNIINISGNNFWWIVNDIGNEIFIHKRGSPKKTNLLEPFLGTGIGDRYVDIVDVIGVTYRQAGYAVEHRRGRFPSLPEGPEYTGIEITCDHPIIRHAGFSKGQIIGANEDIMLAEIDGRRLNTDGTIRDVSERKKAHTTRVIGRSFAVRPGAKSPEDEDALREIGVFVEHIPAGAKGRVVSIGSMGVLQAVTGSKNSQARNMLSGIIDYLENGPPPVGQNQYEGCPWQ